MILMELRDKLAVLQEMVDGVRDVMRGDMNRGSARLDEVVVKPEPFEVQFARIEAKYRTRWRPVPTCPRTPANCRGTPLTLAK